MELLKAEDAQKLVWDANKMEEIMESIKYQAQQGNHALKITTDAMSDITKKEIREKLESLGYNLDCDHRYFIIRW